VSHGGQLDACSADGRTTFTLRLPRTGEASAGEAEPGHGESEG